MQTDLLSLAALSHEAYGSQPVDRREFFGRRSCSGFVQQLDGYAVLSFRGTDAIDDWLTNLDIGTAYAPGIGLVHEGFAEALESQLDDIDRAMSKLGLAPYWVGSKQMQPIVCTGHSLGGALAILMSGRMRARATCAVTFGCPRIASRWTELKTAIPSWNVVHGFDVVPRLPRIGFQSVGETIYWGAGRISRFLWRPLAKGVADHRIARYVEHVMEHSSDNQQLTYANGVFSMERKV
jgi:predicted lipase